MAQPTYSLENEDVKYADSCFPHFTARTRIDVFLVLYSLALCLNIKFCMMIIVIVFVWSDVGPKKLSAHFLRAH